MVFLRVIRVLLLCGVAITARAISVDTLRVEYADRPLALDVARPRLSWLLHANDRAQRQTACEIVVASSEDALVRGQGDVWSSGKIESADNFGLEFGGPELRSFARYYWRVRVWDREGRASEWSAPSWWQMSLLAPADWTARWIGSATPGSPLLRHEFRIGKPVVRATAYAYARGWYRLWVNGAEITERVLAPVNSNYKRALYYDAYDLTADMKEGANALGLWLGNGYGQGYSKYGWRWNELPSALVQLRLEFADGSTETIGTDASWKQGESPVLENDIYNGETYDARREQSGWSTAGFDDSGWQPVALREAPSAPLKSCPFPGIVVANELRPVKLTEPKPDVFVFDLGQNIAGWVRLRVGGPAGTKVTLRHAEEVHPDGTLDVTTNRAARATDSYTLHGGGPEVYEPRFTYHGYRYVEVTGFPGAPTLESITGRAIHAAVADAGDFDCSEPLINRIHQNFRWSIANNLVGIPTDTAARDERTPCQMDSLAVEEAAMGNFAMNRFYTKWLADIAADGGDLPSWSGDQVVLPFLLYENDGDRRILAEQYENMKRVVERFAARAEKNEYWAKGFGDWAAPSATGSYQESFSEGELVGRAFFQRCAAIVAETAGILGRADDAQRFAQQAAEIRAAFDARFYHADTATYSSGRQVTSILPLAFSLVAPANRPVVVAALCRRIADVDHSHLDTGIFGTRYLFDVLIDGGHPEVAYEVLTKPGYPGYPDQIAQGATTTWEQWRFRGRMQTHDHAMFAGPDATLFSRFGGIQPAAPGFRQIIIRPTLAGMSRVTCDRDTVMGRISCAWERLPGKLSVRVSIPVNATATIYLPASAADRVLDGGIPAANAAGVSAIRMEGNVAVVSVGSGEYRFTVAN